MPAKVIEIIVLEGIAVSMFAFAYAIGIKHKMHLIAGYNRRTAQYVHDKPGLARLVARLCVLVGGASAFMPLATGLWGDTSTGMAMWIGGYGGFVLGVTALTMAQAREFTTSKRKTSHPRKGSDDDASSR